jgi:radical SAM superfamily enzyme YgiQ (UPF0313 family)
VTTPVKRVEDLNKLPLPVYDEDVYPAMAGNQKLRVVLLEESRGCPNGCSFCMHSLKSGRRWRTKDPVLFVDQMEEIMRKYRVNAFRFAGSSSPPELMREIAREIIRRKLKVTYSAFSHVRGMTPEHFALLRESGCCALAFGVESGSQAILDRVISKKVPVGQIRNALVWCREAGIKAIASIIVPAPMETEETKKETLDLLLEARPDSVVVFFPALVPGTDWAKDPGKYGFAVQDEKTLYEKAMTYRVNHLCPPVLWRSMPDYSLNGRSFREMGEETARFVQVLKNHGITTQLLDQIFLISAVSRIEAGAFADRIHRYFSGGDHAAIRELVANVNTNVGGTVYRNG